MKTALTIGRFQPFHKGHESVLDAMRDAGIQHIIIGIGSSQYSREPKNPWTAEERHAMILQSLAHRTDLPSIRVVYIPDIHDDAGWVAHVDGLVGSYDVVYTANQWVADLMKEAGHAVAPIRQTVQISASEIRAALLAQNHAAWKPYIQETIHDVLLSSTIPPPSDEQAFFTGTNRFAA